MHPFLINYIAFCFVVILLLSSRQFKFKHSAIDSVFVVISFIVFSILHIGVDVNSVEDLPNYKDLFQKIASSNFSNFHEEILTTDYFYAFVNKCVASFSDDFMFFLLFYNLFLLFSHYYLYIKYSPYIPLSIVIFLLSTYNQSLFVLRQYLAISIVLLSIPSIFKKKLLNYLLICVTAVFTHSSALVWLPVYFIYNTKDLKSFFFRLIIATIGYIVISLIIIQYMSMFFLEFTRYVDNSVKTTMTTIVINFFFLLLYVFYLKKHIFDEGINRLCFISLYFILIGYMFAPPMESMARVLQYYTTISSLSLPISMSYTKSGLIRAIFVISFLIIEGILVMRGLDEFYFAYYSFDNVPVVYLLVIILLSLTLPIIIKREFLKY